MPKRTTAGSILDRIGGTPMVRLSRIATILADSANRYLSTIYNDEWMREKFGDRS
jgi:hypothetical protein